MVWKIYYCDYLSELLPHDAVQLPLHTRVRTVHPQPLHPVRHTIPKWTMTHTTQLYGGSNLTEFSMFHANNDTDQYDFICPLSTHQVSKNVEQWNYWIFGEMAQDWLILTEDLWYRPSWVNIKNTGVFAWRMPSETTQIQVSNLPHGRKTHEPH